MGFRYLDRVVSEDNIRSLLDLADLAAGGGLSADNVFQLSHRLRQSNPMQVCQRLLARDPKSTALIQQRRLSGPYDPEALLALPKGSLGHTYAVVLKTMGDDINFFPKPEFYANLESDADYINYRVFATHDIHHIVSGFSLDNYGEMGVVSISVAQFAHPGLTFTDLMSLLLTWFGNDTPIDDYDSIRDQARTAGYAFGMISKGLQMGAEASPLFPVLWEERMAQNLQELRAELGIEAVLEGPWSWASNPAIQEALGL